MSPGESPTSTDGATVDTVDDSTAQLGGEERLQSLIAAWLLSFKSPHTVRNYRTDLAHWLAFCADHGIDPLEARRAHIDAWARVLESLGLKERSVGRRLSAVSSWYQYLVHDGVLPASPTQHVRRPKVSDEGTTPGLTRDELRRLLAAARASGSVRSVALVSLLAHTGLRMGEALSRDVEHLAHDRGQRILRLERKGGRGGRTGPVVRALDDYLAGRTTGPLFVTTTGRRLDQPEAGV